VIRHTPPATKVRDADSFWITSQTIEIEDIEARDGGTGTRRRQKETSGDDDDHEDGLYELERRFARHRDEEGRSIADVIVEDGTVVC